MTDDRRRYGSAREWVYHELRERILSGELAGGQQLRSRPLTEQFGVSVSPLREAIHQLAANGFVELSPQRGARVTAISPGDLTALYEARRLIEPEAARRSVLASDEAHVEAVGVSIAQVKAPEPGDSRGRTESAAAEEVFLAAVTQRCDNRWLLGSLDTLRSHTSRARTVLAAAVTSESDVAVLGEIADAATAGAADRAAELLGDLLAARVLGTALTAVN